MKALIVSKALVVAAYRRKLRELARCDVDVVAVVPPEWREGSEQKLEPGDDEGYELLISPIRWNGHFHVHYYPQLPRIMDSVRPDLLHMDEEPYNLATYLGIGAAARRTVPSLFFTWQNLARRYPPPFRQMERAVYRWSAHAVAGSSEAADVLRAKGYRGPVTVVPQFGVDPAVFAPGVKEGPFTVGALNRLVPEKDPLLTLDAFAALPPDARLIFVGDGPLRGELEGAIDAKGLRDRVTIHSRIPSQQMPDLIRSLDVVVLPSRATERWKEQFGRVLIEAMACGVPVVASDSGEIPRVLGDAGIIFPEDDRDAFATALCRIHSDPVLREQLGEAGRRRALERFTHAQIAQRTAEVYRSIT